jgi:hypothetical protein
MIDSSRAVPRRTTWLIRGVDSRSLVSPVFDLGQIGCVDLSVNLEATLVAQLRECVVEDQGNHSTNWRDRPSKHVENVHISIAKPSVNLPKVDAVAPDT